MKIQIKNNFGESAVMDFSSLSLDDFMVLLKYSGKLTIETIER